MVCRCCICLLMCCITNTPFILEQPGSSLLEWHPYFQLLCRRFKIYRVFVWLGSFGGGSPKPTLLYSNYQWIQSLYLPLPSNVEWTSEMSRKYIDGSGILRVCGGSDLKNSQYYPKLFGHAVAQAFQAHAKEVQDSVKTQLMLGSSWLPNISSQQPLTGNQWFLNRMPVMT
ncbi:unnamed protein product [Cladocopium goreaui]|uniref:Uncharacterized protein n=1 Tax=Cladocopium goreaui TaxID=2562237 RepID=A0A9P1CZK6_9DINO|nr:unnamed protein product [Cladocopium goreaui]CAI4016389.1 unnamed protein product [Cladocopium goreaui]CAI4020955.1 unnamed protein product [Cladocopium goreaui]